MITSSLRKRLQSFRHALRGAVFLLRTQPNARIHAVATLGVVGAGFGLAISRVDWALIIVAVTLVWTAEALNTAVEFLADAITLDQNERIGKAKDVAACGVLVTAIAAVVIGLIVFVPHLLRFK